MSDKKTGAPAGCMTRAHQPRPSVAHLESQRKAAIEAAGLAGTYVFGSAGTFALMFLAAC